MDGKERVLKKCYKLLSDIYTAQSCLECAKILAEKIVNDDIHHHQEFFDMSYLSFLYTGTMLLSKTYENDKDVVNINKIINIFLTTNISNEKQKKDFQSFHNQLQKLTDVTSALKFQRDKFYAHNDKKEYEDLLQIAILNFKDKNKLIGFANKVLSYAICVLENREKTAFVYRNIATVHLECVLNDIENYYKSLQNELEHLQKENNNGE